MLRFTPSRRDLLEGSWRVSSSPSPSHPHIDALAQDAGPGKTRALDQVDTFLAIDGKGMVTLYAGKVDLGTGVRIGFAQIVAEELDVPLANVTVIEGDTALTPDQGPPMAASRSRLGGMQIRQAAATARSALLDKPRSGWAPSPTISSLRDGVDPREGGRHQHDLCRSDRRQEFHAEGRSCGAHQKILRTTRSSASRLPAATFRKNSPAASPTCRISGCRACCMEA